MYLHTHDGQLVSSISARWYQMTIICFAREHNHGFCVSPSVRLVNEFNNMPVPSKAKQQGKTLEDMSKDFLDSCSVSITDVWFVTAHSCWWKSHERRSAWVPLWAHLHLQTAHSHQVESLWEGKLRCLCIRYSHCIAMCQGGVYLFNDHTLWMHFLWNR